MMNLMVFSFDEYGELVGVSVEKDMSSERVEVIESELSELDDDEIEWLEEGGFEIDGGNGVEVGLYFEDVRYMFLKMSDESSVDGWWYSNKKEEGYEEYGDVGVYFNGECEEELEENDYEGRRRVYDLMIDIEELNNYHMRRI